MGRALLLVILPCVIVPNAVVAGTIGVAVPICAAVRLDLPLIYVCVVS